MLTHVPVIGTIFAASLLALAIVRRSDELARVAFGAFALLAIIATVVFLTGEAAEKAVEGLVGMSESVIERHEEAALIGLPAG